MLPANEQLATLSRGAAEILPLDEFRKRLEEGTPLRVKYGIDPTGPDVHIGHAVPIRKLRAFQNLGHQVVLIIGDFTALIGDPSGRSESRPQLTREQVQANLATYLDQISLILDLSRTEVRYNSEWLAPLNSEQIIRLAGTHTVAQLLAREDFANRLSKQLPFGLDELLYPLFQGYDSVVVRADVEIGATEQKFSFLTARELQLRNPFGPPQRPQAILTMPILVGTDGKQKMGKSLKNYIGLREAPDQMFGKLMSLPDEVIGQYFELCTDAPLEEIRRMEAEMRAGDLNPRDAKLRLGEEIVTLYHGKEAARKAREDFLRLFSGVKKATEEELAEMAAPLPIPEALKGKPVWASTVLLACGLVTSRGEARRAIAGGGAYLDERRLMNSEEEVSLQPGMILRVGKRRMVKLL